MKNDCVLYVRVSSDIQDYERQIVELKDVAKKNKFKIPSDGIFEDKLSGFKDENERIGLKNLMDYCLKHSIEVVLVWELSRLARKHFVLMRLVEFFNENKINVYVKKQDLWLFNEDGVIDDRAGMMISVMGWYSEYEGRLMRERFLSQKRLNESLGKYNGGFIPFGYTIDDNKRFIVDNSKIKGLNVSESDIIKEVFDLYESGLTCSKICRICRSKNYPKIVCDTHTLARLLRNTSYIGEKETRLGKRPTPIIISKSQFLSVNKKIDENKTKADKGRKHVYLLRGVLKCKVCGNYYIGKQTDDTYICPLNSGSNVTNKGTHCEGENISISNLDGIIWDITKRWLKNNRVDEVENFVRNEEMNITDLEIQKERFQVLIKTTEQRRKKANIIFQNDGYSIKEYESAIKEIKTERRKCEEEIESIDASIRYYEKVNSEVNSLSKRTENIMSISDRRQIQTIIKSIIQDVVFYRTGLFKTFLFVTYFNGYSESIIYNSVAKKGSIYKKINFDRIVYDHKKSIFYSIMKTDKAYFQASTEILQKQGIGKDLPDIIHLRDFIRILRKHNLPNPEVSHYLITKPVNTEIEILEFDDVMNLDDMNVTSATRTYEKITYFKDLNKARFNRKMHT